jgi:hypothetical protein
MTTVDYLDQDFAITIDCSQWQRQWAIFLKQINQMAIIINDEITGCFLFLLEFKNDFSLLTCLRRVNVDVDPPTNNSKILECGEPNMSSC